MSNEIKQNQPPRGTVKQLSKKERNAAFRRWTFVAGLGWNYETQQAPSVAYAMARALRKIYPNDDDYIEAMDNHFKYFNITPQMGNVVLGATLAMEEKDGLKAKDAVQNLKVSLMGPLSGVGDSIFWLLWPTIIGGIAGYMALQGNPTGAIVWTLVSAALYFVKMGLSKLGYSSGTKLITSFSERLNIFTDAISVMGLMVVGTIVATVVKVYTPLKFSTGKVSLSVQTGVLDKIMPALLPAALAGLTYWLLGKKWWTPTKIILLLVVISLVGTFFNILGIAPAK
ncbi:PTS system mannose/fructose/sorbose family transporter subunit IID [Lactobacillus rhamnosus]|uniref:PTS system mannose/fructose/sorbose family transporter subunit IID n=1 Tax=Lacticaseibacillus rhamnosus TaxID=47715 RepID=A0A7Y7QHL2_LACRH|nr:MULTISPECIES: PTS system mannose/fructose/sorbose family transporter subunit IID [Lacticaseibacillus]ALX89724.1 PTS fructose transporter subunit IID [Lacticaseibacillus paracasei]NVO89286.1 PTS system mannose/fructose/sorbose family transporter subunit IID [Lacticaseibacillus rhamnosus]RND60915.1 PTS system mannose-specific EIID component [Lacticaseibacillus paracasei]